MSARSDGRHPAEGALALFAGGDLPWYERLRISRHVTACPACGRTVRSLRDVRATVKVAAAGLPEGLDWERLASEMTANIHVGVAAGQCVGPVPKLTRAPRLGWRPAAAFASVAVLVTGGWWLSSPPTGAQRVGELIHHVWRHPAVADSDVLVGMATDGIELKQNGAVMTLMYRGASPAVVTASTQGAVRARYVDADTGQVTITNVYAQ